MRAGQNRTPDFVTVLREAAAQAVEGIFVGMPGVITKYNPGTQTADVLPLLKRPYINDDGTRGADALPVLPNVRVLFPRGGGYFVSLPLGPGDGVGLIFMDRSIDDWEVSSGKVPVDPEELRQHDLSDAIAIPGLCPLPGVIKDVIASGAAFGKEKGAQVRATGSDIEITSAGLPASVGGYVAMENLVNTLWLSLTVALDAFVAAPPPPPDAGIALATALSAAIKAVPSYLATGSTNLKAD